MIDDHISVSSADGRKRRLTPLFGLPVPGGRAAVRARAAGEFLVLRFSSVGDINQHPIVAAENDVLTLHVGPNTDAVEMADRMNSGPWFRVQGRDRTMLGQPVRVGCLPLEREWAESESQHLSPLEIPTDPLDDYDFLCRPLRRFVRLPLAWFRPHGDSCGTLDLAMPWGPEAHEVTRALNGCLRMHVFPFVDRSYSRLDGFSAPPSRRVHSPTLLLRPAAGVDGPQSAEILAAVELRSGRRGRSRRSGWPRVDDYLEVQHRDEPNVLAGVSIAPSDCWTLWIRHDHRGTFPRDFAVIEEGDSERLRAESVPGGASPSPARVRGSDVQSAPTSWTTRLQHALGRFDFLELNQRFERGRVKLQSIWGTTGSAPLRFIRVDVPLAVDRSLPEHWRLAAERELEHYLNAWTLPNDRVVVRLLQPYSESTEGYHQH